jgi:hypothetical protein
MSYGQCLVGVRPLRQLTRCTVATLKNTSIKNQAVAVLDIRLRCPYGADSSLSYMKRRHRLSLSDHVTDNRTMSEN